MANQDASLNVRNYLIYMGYFTLGYDMVELGSVFGISKQMVSKIIDEISVKSVKTDQIKIKR